MCTCWDQLTELSATTEERRDQCKATLGCLAHKCANPRVDTELKNGLLLNRNYMDT